MGGKSPLEKPECTSSHHSSSLFNSNRHNENRGLVEEAMQSNFEPGQRALPSLTSKDPVRRQRDIWRAWSVATDSLGWNSDLWPCIESLATAASLCIRMQSVGNSHLEELLNCVKHSDHTVPPCVCTCYSLDVTSLGPMWPTIRLKSAWDLNCLKPGPEYIISGLNVITGTVYIRGQLIMGISLWREKT